MGAMHFLHQQCILAALCCDVFAGVPLIFWVSTKFVLCKNNLKYSTGSQDVMAWTDYTSSVCTKCALSTCHAGIVCVEPAITGVCIECIHCCLELCICDTCCLQLVMEIEKAQKMAARKDYYKILGIAQTAQEREVKQSYREMARKYHPDKAESQGLTVQQAEAKFTDIAEAYEILSDYEKRAAYDRGDDVEVHQNSGFPGPFGQGFPGARTQYTFHFG